MANQTKCLTSGAMFHIAVSEEGISAKVNLPFKLDIDEAEAIVLETLIHNQLELVLRSYFEGATMAVEHDDAKYQFWVDIERENEAEIDEWYREVERKGNPPDENDEDEDEKDDSPHQ